MARSDSEKLGVGESGSEWLGVARSGWVCKMVMVVSKAFDKSLKTSKVYRLF